jgi:hypothetical protein
MAKSNRNPLDPFTLNIGRLRHEWNAGTQRPAGFYTASTLSGPLTTAHTSEISDDLKGCKAG